MQPPLLAIPLALEWLLLATSLAPILLPRVFPQNPELALATWFAVFLSAGLVLFFSIGVAIWSYLASIDALGKANSGAGSFIDFLILSFGPWLFLALTGIALALLNNRIEPALEDFRRFQPMLELVQTEFMTFERIPVFEIQSEVPIAFSTKRSIFVSTRAISLLTQEELAAVLLHEAAHVRKKHFVIKSLASWIHTVSPRLEASRALVFHVERLCEEIADKEALINTTAQTLAHTRTKFGQFDKN